MISSPACKPEVSDLNSREEQTFYRLFWPCIIVEVKSWKMSKAHKLTENVGAGAVLKRAG